MSNKYRPIQLAPPQSQHLPDLFGDPALDQVTAHAAPKLKYVIASLNRTGSNLMLRQLLRAGAGLPAEYFSEGLAKPLSDRLGFSSPDDGAYLDFLFSHRQSPNGVFGIKLHWWDLSILGQENQQRIFQDAKVIMTLRRDLAMQALSLELALQTGRWDPRWEPSDPDPEANAKDMDRLLATAEFIVDYENNWFEFFEKNNIEPLVIYFEDYLADHDGVTRQVFEFLNIEGGLPSIEPEPAGRTAKEHFAVNELRNQINNSNISRKSLP